MRWQSRHLLRSTRARPFALAAREAGALRAALALGALGDDGNDDCQRRHERGGRQP